MRKASALKKERKSNQTFLPIYFGSVDGLQSPGIKSQALGHVVKMFTQGKWDAELKGKKNRETLGDTNLSSHPLEGKSGERQLCSMIPITALLKF